MARLWGKQGRCGWPARSERPQPWPRPVEVQGSLEHDLALTDRLCSTCPHAGGRPLGFFFAAASGSSTLALLAEDFSPVSLSPLGGCLDHPPLAVPCQYIPLAPTKQPASASKLTAPDSLVAFGGRPRPAPTIVRRHSLVLPRGRSRCLRLGGKAGHSRAACEGRLWPQQVHPTDLKSCRRRAVVARARDRCRGAECSGEPEATWVTKWWTLPILSRAVLWWGCA